MKENKASVRKRIGKWIENWQRTLFLHDYDITIRWADKDEDTKAGSNDVYVRYYESVITFYPCLFDQSPETQWRVVAHEMLHSVLAPMQRIMNTSQEGGVVTEVHYKDIVEQTCTKLTNIVVSAWPYKK